jgi:hypothetical protein
MTAKTFSRGENIVTEQNDKPSNEKKPLTLGENLQALCENFNRAEITLPKAIIIAAMLIALGLIFS